jgi:hypothetical protein
MDVAAVLSGGMEVFTMRASCSMLALAVVAAGAVSARADNLYQTLIEDRPAQTGVDMVAYQQFSSMEQRLAAMEQRLGAVETVSYAYDDAAATGGCGAACGADCCGCNSCWCNTCCGCTFSAEALWLRAHDSEAFEHDDDFQRATRWTLGYMNNCGREWRVRYFEYDTELSSSDYVQLEYIDAEYAGRFTLGCNWRGELSGGIRWAQYDEEGDLQYADTYGPVLGALVYGPCCYGLDSYASLRQSWQFGSAFDADFGHFSVTEVQLGVQYNFCLCGGNGYLRGAVEVQKWEGVYEFDTQDLGLVGFGVAVGMTR